MGTYVCPGYYVYILPQKMSGYSFLQETLFMEVRYYSPDGTIGDWESRDFDYPLIEMPARREDSSSRSSKSDLNAREDSSIMMLL